MKNSNKQFMWTPDLINKYWNYISQRRDLYPEYFSYQVGNGICNFLVESKMFEAKKNVLDYGCGPGFLLENLLNRDAVCHGFDFSEKSVELVNIKFNGRKNWNKAVFSKSLPMPYEDDTFDIITCIETLEHLLDNMIPSTLNEIKRLLKPNGVALFTTPNEENLCNNYIYCPFCNAEFHKVQHVRSFSKDTLKDLLESFGYKVLFCNNLNFKDFQKTPMNWKSVSIEKIRDCCKDHSDRLLDLLSKRQFPEGRYLQSRINKGPHLCALVKYVNS